MRPPYPGVQEGQISPQNDPPCSRHLGRPPTDLPPMQYAPQKAARGSHLTTGIHETSHTGACRQSDMQSQTVYPTFFGIRSTIGDSTSNLAPRLHHLILKPLIDYLHILLQSISPKTILYNANC